MVLTYRQRAWWIGGLTLVGIWILALVGMGIARRQIVTAKKTVDYIRAHPLASRTADERRVIIDAVACRVNHLTFEERRKFRLEKDLRSFYESMTDAESARYLDLTLSKGLQQAMEAFDEMPLNKRDRIIQRALNEIQRVQAELNEGSLDSVLSEEKIRMLHDLGVLNYWSGANAAGKIDVQLLIEQVQLIMQGVR